MFTDMEFKYPSNAWFFIVPVAAAVFFILAFGKKERIMAALRVGYKPWGKALRTALLFAGLCLMTFSLLGPQVFAGYAEISKTGLDIYVLMDTSKSMLVSDVAPDRITMAKKIVEDLLNALDGDRIGFIPFASEAYIQMPLTDDYELARMFLDVMDTDMIGGGGTNLASAIRLANDSFERSNGADSVILILSDGEEHDNASLELLKSVADDRVKIFTVGIGTEKGGLVPVYDGAGDAIIDYMKDADGNPVTSRLNAETLRQLARDGQGAYHQIGRGAEASALLADLSALKRDDYQMEQIRRFRPLYQYFLGPGLLLFSLAWLLPERRVIA